jgi:Zn-dependent protease
VILPALGAISGIPVIAWAKPVPVNPAGLRNRRRDMLFVSLAGPATNFSLMAAAAIVARLLYSPSDISPVIDYLYVSAFVNLFLGIFNFLPIPPLDGASLVERVLPESWLPGWYRFRPYGILVLFAIVFFTPMLDRILEPFQRVLIEFISHGYATI